jgi:uncharacterized protein (TIGR02284 family)
MANDDAVKVLNDLIRTSEDGKKGFEEAAKRAEDIKLKTLFKDRAIACDSAARELQQAVQELGGKPEDSGSVAGAAHRGWVKVKAAAGDNNIAVLEEVERGEDYAKAAYAKALKTSSLPPHIRSIVEKQYQGVLQNHDRMRELRNRYKAGAGIAA